MLRPYIQHREFFAVTACGATLHRYYRGHRLHHLGSPGPPVHRGHRRWVHAGRSTHHRHLRRPPPPPPPRGPPRGPHYLPPPPPPGRPPWGPSGRGGPPG